MTSEEENGETIYCVCRSTDVNRFMIGCDHCEEWYHGDCINVTEKEAKYIKKFFCKECREKNSHPSIVYKSKFVKKQKEQEEVLKRKENKKQREKEQKKKKDKDRERDRSRNRDSRKERHREKERHGDKDHVKERHKHKHKHKEKDKYKEQDREREKAKVRVKEEIKEETENDLKPVSSTTASYSPTVSTDVKVKDEKVASKDVKEKEEKYKIKKIKEEGDKVKKIEQIQHKRLPLEEIKKDRTNSVDEKDSVKVRKVLAVKDVDTINKYSSEDEWQQKPAVNSSSAVPPVAAAPPPPKPAKEKQSVKRKASKDTRETNKKKRTWRADYSSDESDAERITDMTPRQCYGMECINCARIDSKYCSDQCGLSLASIRIYQTLPERIREWNLTSCKSAETNQKELVKIRAELCTAREKLEDVDREVEQLEQLIAKSKTLAPVEDNSDDSSDDDEQDGRRGGMVNCISCGKDVSTKVAIRHMESCFNKFESQTSYGSLFKTNIEGYEMVCDFYNPQTETYCKRLRVICPEHAKDPKIGDNDVCGYSLTRNIFSPSGEFCRVKKKECDAHFCWEKLRRAELDMERVRCWMKLDELMEQERQEKESLSRRAGVLNLMLHSTFNYEIMDKVMKMQKGKQGVGGGGREGGQQQSHGREGQQPVHGREVHGEHHQRKP